MNTWGSGKRKKVIKNPSLYYKSKSQESNKANYSIVSNILKIVFPIGILIYFTFISNIFSLKEIQISGNSNIETQSIENLIPKGQNLLLINSQQIQTKIIEQIPEIRSVKIYKGIPSAVKIIIEENSPNLVWLTQNKSYLINDKGVAYREIADYNMLTIPTIVDHKNVPILINQKVVSDNFVSFLQKINDNITEKTNLEVKDYYIEETTVDLYLVAKDNIIVKFDTLRDSEQQLENLKIVLMEKKDEIKEYVDLRINGWVYYK